VKALAVLALGSVALGVAGPPPARVQVVAHEFSFQLSRTQLRSGTATIELANFGQDTHDLRVQRVGAHHIAGTPVVQAGSRVDLTVTLRPGRYRFWCSVADHRARGMSATLVVR
jgi:plastocyanin